MQRRGVIAIVLVLAVGAGVWWWFAHRPAAPTSWQGYVEADYIKVSPTQQGLLTALSVARGDAVAAGAPLFAQDDIADRAARDQAARQLAEAQSQLANLQAGGKPTEIRQAQAGLDDARAALTRTEADYKRGRAVLQDGAISIQSLGQLRADEQSATAKAQAAEAALAQLHAPLGRVQEIKTQLATVDAARAVLEAAEWRLAQRHVTAPTAGRIADVLARPGENVAAGAPVVSLLSPGNVFVRFFVPEQALAAIHQGARMALACDTCPLDQTATVSFISPHAEYTPPLIYSDESRTKLVYLIEARPRPDQATQLNPGEPVAVRPMESGAAP